MDLVRSMELAARNLELCLCPTGDYLPYHKLHLDQQYRAKVLFYDCFHNVGRWWDAMLRFEDAVGYQVPPDLEAVMLRHAHEMFDNPDQLPFAPLDQDHVAPSFDLHSLREGVMTLDALAKYRGSRWAIQQGSRMLESMLSLSRPDCTWALEGFDYYEKLGAPEAAERYREPNVSHNGRLIEALVWFYETTGDSQALELADRFAAYHLEHSTHPDGAFNPDSNAGHTHSYLGTLRGLLLFGQVTKQRKYVEAVAATYDVTVRKMIVKESGWTSHNIDMEIADGRGQDGSPEVTSPGDAAQIAMWLGLDAGYPEFLDDVERIVRARILPSQITELPDVQLPSGLDRDQEDKRLWGDKEYRNVGERIMGAYAGMQLEPHAGKRSTTDVTAAPMHTLIDVHNNIANRDGSGIRVNFHFDYEDRHVKVRSARNGEATVKVTPKEADNVFVRIPRWAPTDSVSVAVAGRPVPLATIGDYAHVSRDTFPGEIELRYALPERVTRETTQGIDFEFAWRGDEIMGVCPNSDFFPFYPTADGCDRRYDWTPA